MRTFAWVVLALLAAPVAAQRPPVIPPPGAGIPPAKSAVRPAEFQISVEGCLTGSRLTRALGQPSSVPQDLLRATEFVLEGPKELLRQLAREHQGHQEMITGIAIVPPSPDGRTADITTKKIGPGQVTVGVRQRGAAGGAADGVNVSEAPRPVRIRVAAATHVADQCVSTN